LLFPVLKVFSGANPAICCNLFSEKPQKGFPLLSGLEHVKTSNSFQLSKYKLYDYDE